MNRLVEMGTAREAWEEAVTRLLDAPGHRMTNLVVRISDPADEPSGAYLRVVDDVLGGPTVRSVARTIMPACVSSAADWRARTARVLDKLPRQNFYFRRMVAYDTGAGQVNQVDAAIAAFAHKTPSGGHWLDPGPIVLPRPGYEAMARRNFPCLSQVQFHRVEEALVTTATYRSHHYHVRALGNFIGLGRLASLIAREAGLSVGEVTIVSTDARLGRIHAVRELMGRLEQCTP